MTQRRDLLFEIGTEELPPKALRALGAALGGAVCAALEKAALAHGGARNFASPRRLAVLVDDLAERQAEEQSERRGPALAAAFDEDGNPTPAARGFARSCGVEVEALETAKTDKGAWLVFRRAEQGRTVHELLPGIVAEAVARLPIPKRMRWGSGSDEFVRPVHWLVLLYGEEVVNARLFGLAADRRTRGHRFHHPAAMYLAEPAAYAPLLESEGHVIADFAARREAIRAQVSEAAVAVGGRAVVDEDLLDEVTGMVEWPVAVLGDFDARFLAIPAEALISAMKAHQKYFHVVDAAGALLPHFVTVSNIESRDPRVVRRGNERVIRPRLADAEFFWNQDRKRPLAARIDSLKQVVFQERLGTLYQKTERLTALAVQIAGAIGGQPAWAERAGWLAKCDLMTAMVGEFPELQGMMGRYYAAHDGEPAEVAVALDEQYRPRVAGDALPTTATGRALALADRLDSLLGIFAIGQTPSGDKDPFALRRAALGALRIVIEARLDLDLAPLLRGAAENYAGQGAVSPAEAVVEQVFDFMMERLRGYYLDQGVAPEVFDAVLARRPSRPLDFDRRLRAVEAFRRLPEAQSLAAANKRIGNILRKAGEDPAQRIDAGLFQQDAERALDARVTALAQEVEPLFGRGEYGAALTRLAALRTVVDTYFDEVLVMAEDGAVRRNRLAQLQRLQQLFMQVADLACLHIQR